MQRATGKIRAVLFDFGETLVTFGRVKPRQLFRQSAKLTYDFLQSTGQTVGSFRYYCFRNLVSLRIFYWLSKLTGKDFDSLKLLKKINMKRGIRLDESQWRHLAWLWYEPLSKLGKAEPDIAETLTKLKTYGLKLGILSNTFVHGSCLEKHLEQLGLLDFFSVRLFSYQFNFRKPDPQIFIHAADRIGERLANILFVGDRIRTDIAPTAELGMAAVLKKAHTNISRKLPKGAHRITYLSELPALVEKLNTKAID